MLSGQFWPGNSNCYVQSGVGDLASQAPQPIERRRKTDLEGMPQASF
jgi:hypothetical protein